MVDEFFFKRLVRNGYSQLKCVACNHFVAFFFSAVVSKLPNLPVIIKQNGRAYPVVEEFLQFSCGIIQ